MCYKKCTKEKCEICDSAEALEWLFGNDASDKSIGCCGVCKAPIEECDCTWESLEANSAKSA